MHVVCVVELSQRKTDDVQAEERLIQAHLATKEQELRSAEELIESLKTEMASVRGELHDTKDRKDGTEKEMVAVKGTVKQQSEQIEQVIVSHCLMLVWDLDLLYVLPWLYTFGNGLQVVLILLSAVVYAYCIICTLLQQHLS